MSLYTVAGMLALLGACKALSRNKHAARSCISCSAPLLKLQGTLLWRTLEYSEAASGPSTGMYMGG